jgi:hypothetical protein
MTFSRGLTRTGRMLLLLGLALAPGAVSAQAPTPPTNPAYTLAGIDIFGATKTPESFILGVLSVKDDAEITPELVTKLDQKLRATGKFAYSQVSSTEYGNRKVYLSVDVVEKGDEKHLDLYAAPTGDVAVPEDILDWVRRYEKASFQLFQVRPRGQQDLNDGHFIDSDPGLREYQEKMLEMVPPHYDILVKGLKEDKDPSKRAACATLLGYAKDKQAVTTPLEGALRDPVVDVRASAARSLVPIAYVAAHSSLSFPMEPVLALLHLPTASDRTKAVALLVQLAANEQYHPLIRQKAGEVLVQMAAAKQPAQRERSVVVLTIITGEQYGRDAEKWKAWWKAQKAGTWTPPGNKKKDEESTPPSKTVKS